MNTRDRESRINASLALIDMILRLVDKLVGMSITRQISKYSIVAT